MKKRMISFLLSAMMVLPLLLVGARPALAEEHTVITAPEDNAQAVFAAGEITAALEKVGSPEGWTVALAGTDETLGEQAYRITVEDQIIAVVGGDDTGLMYGGLEVAEQIAIGGVESVAACEGAPAILNRGIKFNAPLDMRTPSYTDAGDAAQNNIATMWDIDFWKQQFDAMARCRMNIFTLWNLDPFPSMVKVPEYPDVALNDVWKMTLPLDDSYNTTASNYVRDEHWENYEVVKAMTIDEKIAFWQEVMQYAADRGIDFYIVTWNIYTYGEHGQYGIDNDINNPVTRDYYRASVRELLRTYPLLKGIGVTAGENINGENDEANEKWLWETYGQGINDVLSETPEREILLYHRMHWADFASIQNIWSDFKGRIEYSEKYSWAHMLSYEYPTFANETLEKLPEGDKLWMEIRNDDSYSFRWADADYLRAYLGGLPDESKLAGFLMGADGYILAREYSVVDEDLKGQSHIDKNWLFYTMMGRIGYDKELPNERFAAINAAHYNEIPKEDADKLFEAMAAAGKIIPRVHWLYSLNTDAWYPEMCFTEKRTYKFVDIKKWVNNGTVMPDAPVMSMRAYAQYLADGAGATELLTPPEIAAQMREYANAALKLVAELEAKKPAVLSTVQQKDFYAAVTDQKSYAYLGLFYADRADGAVALRRFNDTEKPEYLTEAVNLLKSSAENWKIFAELFAAQYLPQQYGRIYLTVDPTALIKDVEKDISTAEKWKPRKY